MNISYILIHISIIFIVIALILGNRTVRRLELKIRLLQIDIENLIDKVGKIK